MCQCSDIWKRRSRFRVYGEFSPGYPLHECDVSRRNGYVPVSSFFLFLKENGRHQLLVLALLILEIDQPTLKSCTRSFLLRKCGYSKIKCRRFFLKQRPDGITISPAFPKPLVGFKSSSQKTIFILSAGSRIKSFRLIYRRFRISNNKYTLQQMPFLKRVVSKYQHITDNLTTRIQLSPV